MLNFYLLTAMDSVTTSNWSSSYDLIGRFFSIIFIFIFVLVLAYYATKTVANSRLQGMSSNNMKILESVSVGYQSVIQLMQIGDSKYIIIAVSKDKVTLLADIDKESLNLEERGSDIYKIPFEKYLKTFIKKDANRQEDED